MAYPSGGRDLSASTINKWITKEGIVDAIYASNGVLDTLKETGKRQGKRGVPAQRSVFRVYNGGEFIQDAPILNQSAASTDVTGDEVLTSVATDPLEKALWPVCLKGKIVQISEKDTMRNRGEAQMVDEEQVRITEGLSRVMYDVNYDITARSSLCGVSSYNGVNGLPGMISTSGTSATDTIGGITRASTLTGWLNQAATTCGAFATYYTKLTLQQAVCNGASKAPMWNLLITTPTVWAGMLNKFLSLGQVQLQNDKDPDTGYAHFRWLGAKVVMDQSITAGYIYGIPTEDMWFYVDSERNFKVDEKFEPPDQFVYARKIKVACQVGFRRFSGVGVTTGWS